MLLPRVVDVGGRDHLRVRPRNGEDFTPVNLLALLLL